MYKIQENQACGNYCILINDKSIKDLSEKETTKLLNHLFAEYKKGLKDGTCRLIDFIECFQQDNSVYSEDSCECCGDAAITTSWII